MRQSKTAILKGVENIRASKIVAPNTVEYFVEEDRHVRLHNTDILVFVGDSLRLSSGGWRTNTTKDRINKFLPEGYTLRAEKGFWYITGPDRKEYTFVDGMVIDLDTGLSDAPPYVAACKAFREDQKRRKRFVDGYVKLLLSGKMGLPGAGDCFFCQGNVSHPAEKFSDHIKSHIEEGYNVPSLIWAAYRYVYGERAGYWLGAVKALQEGNVEVHADAGTLKRVLRKYIRYQIGV